MSNPESVPGSPDARAEQRRHAPGKLVLSIHRILKACLLYSNQNQAVHGQIGATVAAIGEFCALRDAPSARVLFSDRIVFVNRRILKGSRETTALGLELGALLARFGVTELTIERSVSRESMGGFARAVADAQRDPAAARRILEGHFPGITARKVDLTDADVMPEVEKSTVARVVRNYAASVLLLRRAYEAIGRGDLQYANRAKRVAQKLVALGDEDPQLLVSLAAARFMDADAARVAVSTAVIAVAMARSVTWDPVALASLATAALLAECGHLRLGEGPSGADRTAASALVVLIALGRLEPSAAARTVIAHEALRLEHGPPLGREPVVLAQLLSVARRFNALRVPAAGVPATGVDVAIGIMRAAAADATARLHHGLLVSGLGFFPLGTMVELTTGEVAVVMGAPAMSVDFARPPVQILADASGALIESLATLNLKKPPPGQPDRAIARALPADMTQVGALAERV